MKCPACHKEVPDGMKFCGFCASPLGTDFATGEDLAGSDSNASIGEQHTVEGVPGSSIRPQDVSIGDKATVTSVPGGGNLEEKEIGSRYRVEEVLGRGGMGVVYRCRDGKLDREVAVKRLLASEKASRAGLERFLREARTIAGLNHRNVVQVHDIGEDANGSYIVMEYIRGGTLKDRLRESGKYPVVEVLKLARQIGQGLAYAHRKGVIHRDIKPANIFIDSEGVCKVGDFGLARFGTESELSMTGYGMGTLDYMPPEQRRDAKRADHRADIYSFGATLYELVTGKSPRTVRESELPGELRVAVLKAMEELPEDRYFSVTELMGNLAKGGGKQSSSVSVGTVEKGKCPSCSHNNELSSKYCESCGAGLFGKCPKCSEEIRLGLKHCPKCGVEIEKLKKFRNHIESGDVSAEEGRFSRALKEYEAALELIPGDEETEEKLAGARESRDRLYSFLRDSVESRTGKDYERERELLREVLKIAPGREEAVSRLGEIDRDIIKNTVSDLLKKAVEARTVKDYERERELLDEVLRIAPGRKDVVSRLGEIDRDIIEDTVSSLIKEAAEARTVKHYKREREILDEVLKIAPGREEAVSRLGEIDRDIIEDTVSNLIKEAAEARTGKHYWRERKILGEVLKIDPQKKEAVTRLDEIDRDIDFLVGAIEERLGNLVWVKPGSFKMGSDRISPAEHPVHKVRIKRGYFIGKYPIIQGLYQDLIGDNPSEFRGKDHPVEGVSWYDAMEFCQRATETLGKEGKLPEGWEVRLPTEAEWEYACRAGTETEYYWGKKLDGDYCWYYGNSRRGGIFSNRSTHPVGQKKPNPWGLYDMIGNVWEWCRSLYKEYPYREDDGREDVKADGSRVLRGGSWLFSGFRDLFSSYRGVSPPDRRGANFGFRVVLGGPLP